MPNVEPALHSYRHPLSWKMKKYPELTPKASFGSLDEKLETETAVEIFEKRFLKPSGKSEKVYYWTGNCLPPKEILEAIHQSGYLNFNGGDSRWDSHYPSISYLSPLGRKPGQVLQVYTGSSNDNIYTNGWALPIVSFAKVFETFERTEGKRWDRLGLKPIDLYFHSFALETLQGVQTIQGLIHRILKLKTSPVFPSVYVRGVQGAYSAEISRPSQNHYQINHFGKLYSFRSKRQPSLFVDWGKTKGILGVRQTKQWTYFHAHPNVDQIEIVLSSKETHSQVPLLIESQGKLNSWKVSTHKLSAEFDPWARGTVVIQIPKVVKNLKIPEGKLVSSDSKQLVIELNQKPTLKTVVFEW